jgi:PAS domain S-box-containing protein
MDAVPVAITYLDEALVHRQCNQAAAAELGLPVEQVLGRHLHETIPGNPAVWAALEGVLETGEPFRSRQVTIHWQNRPAGHSERHYMVAFLPDRDETGRVRGVFAEGQDITELVETRRKLERAQAEYEALAHRLVEVQEAERTYVADQLYNQAAQAFAALRMQLRSLEKVQPGESLDQGRLEDMKTTVDQGILVLHDLARELRPAALDRAPLADVLHDYAALFLQPGGIALRFDAGETARLRPASGIVTAIFRTVQEALTNVADHSQATEVKMALRQEDDTLIVTLADDGVGFDLQAVPHEGVGLIAMRKRIESVGGQLEVTSGAAGTQVVIRTPAGSV